MAEDSVSLNVSRQSGIGPTFDDVERLEWGGKRTFQVMELMGRQLRNSGDPYANPTAVLRAT